MYHNIIQVYPTLDSLRMYITLMTSSVFNGSLYHHYYCNNNKYTYYSYSYIRHGTCKFVFVFYLFPFGIMVKIQDDKNE